MCAASCRLRRSRTDRVVRAGREPDCRNDGHEVGQSSRWALGVLRARRTGLVGCADPRWNGAHRHPLFTHRVCDHDRGRGQGRQLPKRSPTGRSTGRRSRSRAATREWFVRVALAEEPWAGKRGLVVPRDHAAAAAWISHRDWLSAPGIPPGKRNATATGRLPPTGPGTSGRTASRPPVGTVVARMVSGSFTGAPRKMYLRAT